MSKIIAVFKTHFDLGFTDLSSEIIDNIKGEQLNRVKSTIDACDDYVWTMPSWPFYKSFEGDEKKEKEIEHLVKSKNLCWHALPYTTHTEFCGVEEYIRGMYISKFLSEKFGVQKPISAKMTDVPGHTRGIVSLLCKSGVKFIHLGTNPATMPPDMPRLFFWEAKDESRVLVFYSKGGYGTSLLPPDDWKYPVWLALLQTGDNTGPQKSDEINKIKNDAKDYELSFGTMDDFYNQILPYVEDVPVFKLDAADSWIHGVGSFPIEVANLRENRSKVKSIEGLCTIINKDIDSQIIKVYDDFLLFGEHTWGLDVKTALGGDRKYEKSEFSEQLKTDKYIRIEKSWDEQRKRVNDSIDILNSIENELEKGMCVFNPGAKRKNVIIELDEKYKDKKLVLQNGEYINKFMKGNKLYCHIWELSSCSSLEIKIDGEEEPQEYTHQLNTKLYNMNGFARYEYDVFSNQDITNFLKTYSYRIFDWSLHDLGRIAYPECEHKKYYSLEEESYKLYGNAKYFEEELTHCPFAPYTDYKFKLKDKQKTPYVESGNLLFYLNLKENYDVRINKFGSVIDIKTDIANNANHNLYCCDSWVNLFDDERGVVIIPKHTPLFSLGKNEIYEFRGHYQPQAPVVYFNLFNNSWGTNFPQWIDGDMEFEYRIIPYEGTKSDEECFRLANDYLYSPILCAYNFDSLLTLDEGLEIQSIKKEYKGENIVVRIFDTKGETRNTYLKLGKESKYCLCNLLEEPIGEATFGNKIDFMTKPNEIHTFIIKDLNYNK